MHSNVIAILKSNNVSYFRLYEVLNTAIRSAVRNENKDQAGRDRYFWENKLKKNNNGYVGLSKDLSERLDSYFQPSNLKSALRQGVENFRLFVLHIVPYYNDDSLTDREYLRYLEGLYQGL